MALCVGTALVALNHGDRIVSEAFPWSTSWYKGAITYVVPFCVASYGALANGYIEPSMKENDTPKEPTIE